MEKTVWFFWRSGIGSLSISPFWSLLIYDYKFYLYLLCWISNDHVSLQSQEVVLPSNHRSSFRGGPMLFLCIEGAQWFWCVWNWEVVVPSFWLRKTTFHPFCSTILINSSFLLSSQSKKKFWIFVFTFYSILNQTQHAGVSFG